MHIDKSSGYCIWRLYLQGLKLTVKVTKMSAYSAIFEFILPLIGLAQPSTLALETSQQALAIITQTGVSQIDGHKY
jgi:hypothetical protein